MPRATSAKPDPDAVYIAWQAFATNVGGVDVSVHQGQRLRGSTPVVQACASMFVEDGALPDERPSTWQVVEEQDAVAAEAAEAAALMDVHLAVPPAWFAQRDAVVLNRSVRYGHGYGSNASLPVGYATLEAGILVPPDSELVRAQPGWFDEITWQPKKRGRKS